MKRILVKTVFLIFIFFISCETIEDLLTFTINDSTTFTIENNYGVDAPFSFPTPDITTNSSQEFENNNTRANLVKSVKLKQLRLTIQSPEDFTFSFLKSLHIYISADGLDETEIAYRDDIPKEATSIDMETTGTDLKAYVKKDAYDLRFEAVTREAFAKDVTIKAEMEFKVKADPL